MSSNASESSHPRDQKPKQYQAKENKSEANRGGRNERNHRQSSYRYDKDSYNNERNVRNGDRFNGPKYRDNRSNRRNHGSKPKQGGRKAEGVTSNIENMQKMSLEPTKAEETVGTGNTQASQTVAETKSNQIGTTQTAKVKPFHGHYHHKNSNKPRFSKMFSENDKATKTGDVEDPEKQVVESERRSEVVKGPEAVLRVEPTQNPAETEVSKSTNDEQGEI